MILAGLSCIGCPVAFAENREGDLAGFETVPKSPWTLSAGPLVRDFPGGTFYSGSSSQAVALPEGNSTYELDTGSAGPESGQVLRGYDNGFVGPDSQGTASGSLFEGTTSRFGYEAESQVRDGFLVYQSQLSGTAASSEFSSSATEPLTGEDPDGKTGFQVELSYLPSVTEKRVRIGARFGLSWSPYKLRGQASNFFASRIDSIGEISGTLTDSYVISEGVILPPAPYNQPDADPGAQSLPRISATPERTIDASVVPVSETTTEWRNRLDHAFDADVFTFSVGPDTRFGISDSVFLFASAGVSFHFVDWRANTDEALFRTIDGGASETVNTWGDRSGGTEPLLGVFFQGGGGIHIGSERQYSLQVFIRRDWVESISRSAGPSALDIGFDAYTAGLSLGYTF